VEPDPRESRAFLAVPSIGLAVRWTRAQLTKVRASAPTPGDAGSIRYQGSEWEGYVPERRRAKLGGAGANTPRVV
jgi:hypothetical protein